MNRGEQGKVGNEMGHPDSKAGGDFIAEAVEAVGEAIYCWDIESDRLSWSANAARVLGVRDETLLESGKHFASLLDRENITTRYDTVMHSADMDGGDGVAFSIEYMIRPWGRDHDKIAWLEDTGCWFAGDNGRPARVYGVIRRIDERHDNDQRLHYLGSFDPLTGLMNRGRLGEALDEAAMSAERAGSSCAFLIVSVDNLSVIADAYGFDIADEVMRKVGERLARVARGGDTVARYSDAKFGLILHDCRMEDLKVANERFLNVVNEQVMETQSGPVWAMVSIGSAILPDHAHEHNGAMACAEEALAAAGTQPTKAAVIYQPELNRLSERALNARCAAEIVNSLRYNRFTLAFQPIVDARTGEAVMHESLLRMEDDDGDIIAAVHLIPIAERLGLIRLIDTNVMDLAITTLKAHPDACLTMNLSGITAADPRWFERIIRMLQDNRDVTSRLVVEITETVVIEELADTKRFIAALRELGCRVAIDDFGSGYTSFRNLKELDVDIVKLDGVFCDKLSENPDNQYFVRSLVDLAHKIGVKIIAEWVQTEADAVMLRDWGVDYFQGFLYGEARIDQPWPSPRLENGYSICKAEEPSLPRQAETPPPARRKSDQMETPRESLAPSPDSGKAEEPATPARDAHAAAPPERENGEPASPPADTPPGTAANAAAPAPAEDEEADREASLSGAMQQLEQELCGLKDILRDLRRETAPATEAPDTGT